MPQIHKSYANFTANVSAMARDGGIWGPLKSGKKAVPLPLGHKPPVEKPSQDNYEWGVGEEAEFVMLGPIVDNTNVLDFKLIKGFPNDEHPHMRVSCLPVVHRVSRRLLWLLHSVSVDSGVDMRAEFGPETFALHHGFKIAVWPMPSYYDPVEDNPRDIQVLERELNSQGPDKHPYRINRPDYQNKFMERISYWWPFPKPHFPAPYPQELYRRWLGDEGFGKGGAKDTGRLCLPGILLHPVKDAGHPREVPEDKKTKEGSKDNDKDKKKEEKEKKAD